MLAGTGNGTGIGTTPGKENTILASVVGGREHDPDYDLEDLPSSSESYQTFGKSGDGSPTAKETFAGITVTTRVQQKEDKVGEGDDTGSTKELI